MTKFAFACLAAFAAVLLAAWPATGQESPSHVMARVSVTAVGDTASSTNYETNVLRGQESPVGATSFCKSGLSTSFGYWSIVGDLPVPVTLQAEKVSDDPLEIELRWSGNDPAFEVYRAFSPVGVVGAAHLDAVTPMCTWIDEAADESGAIYYVVLPQP